MEAGEAGAPVVLRCAQDARRVAVGGGVAGAGRLCSDVELLEVLECWAGTSGSRPLSGGRARRSPIQGGTNPKIRSPRELDADKIIQSLRRLGGDRDAMVLSDNWISPTRWVNVVDVRHHGGRSPGVVGGVSHRGSRAHVLRFDATPGAARPTPACRQRRRHVEHQRRVRHVERWRRLRRVERPWRRPFARGGRRCGHRSQPGALVV